MRRIILLLALITFFNVSYAQRYEIGLFAGGNNIVGDVGSDFYVNPNYPTGGVLFKWNKNERVALRANVYYSLATGKSSTQYPYVGAETDPAFEFVTTVGSGELLLEWNFFHFDLRDKDFSQTPYMFLGVGALIFLPRSGLNYTTTIPFGGGYKYALTDRMVVAADLSFRYSFTNDLDHSEWNKIGNLNSNDWFTTIGITLTYVFGRDPCACGQ